MSTEPTGQEPAAEPEREGSTWVVLFNTPSSPDVDHVLWMEREVRMKGLTRREAEKEALALASAEQGIVVVPESSWKPKVAEPPREPRIADFDPWAGA